MVELTITNVLLIILAVAVIVWLIWWLNSKKSAKRNNTNITLGGVSQQIPQQNQMASQLAAAQLATSQSSTQVPNQQFGYGIPSDQSQNEKSIIYYFNRPGCGHCTNFTSVWKDIARKMEESNLAIPKSIDTTNPENENLVFYYNINQVPTIILATPDKNIEYTGNRNLEDIYQFVASNLN